MRKDMRFSWAKVAFMAVLAGSIAGSAMAAKPQQSNDVRLDLTLKDADMMMATNTLFMRAGISFVVEPSSEPFRKITLKLENVTPEEAVRYICQSAGAYFRRDDNGVYVISHRQPAPVEPVTPVGKRQPMPLKRIKLLRASAEDVYDMIMYRLPFDSARGFEKLRKFASLGSPSSSNRAFGPSISPQTTQSPFQTFGPVQAPADLQSNESGSAIGLPGDESSQQLGGGRGFGGGGAGGQGGLGGGGGIGGGQGGLGGGQGGGNATLRGGEGLVPEGIDFISFDPTDNSLVVRGDEDAINTLQTYINLFDIAPRQVQIKVEFITTTESLDRSFGTEFLYQRGTVITGTRPGSFVRATDPVFLNYATGNVTARLRASITNGGGKVVSAPILRTLNNQPAIVSSTIQTTIFYNTTTVSNGTVITQSNPFQLPASTVLSVAPRINDDNTITMYLTPQITNFVGTSRSPDGQEFPNISQQFIQVVARVRNNETIVLGGLNQKNETNSASKVPVLGDLPIIGQFFTFKTTVRSNSELLVFVTPSIVDEDTTGNPGGP